MSFDWKLIVETCPAVVAVEPSPEGTLAIVHIDMVRVMELAKETEPPAGIAEPEWWALNRALECVRGHGIDVLSTVDSPHGVLSLRVRRKLLAALWQRLRLWGGG